MKEWQAKYNNAKYNELYAIFFNLITFLDDFKNSLQIDEFASYNNLGDLSKLIVLNEDDDYNVPGVIGMGIKSTVLYNISPHICSIANKNTLYGFYFLSNQKDFGLPSKTNEFTMINDLDKKKTQRTNTNYSIDQNYWYPYDLFTLYCLRLYRKLKLLCMQYHLTLDDSYRFVHINSFMDQIWKFNETAINTMMGGKQDDAR